MSRLKARATSIHRKSRRFANFSSIGIQIGGIGGLAPSRKSDIARLGLWALLGGSLATFMSATIAGILLG